MSLFIELPRLPVQAATGVIFFLFVYHSAFGVSISDGKPSFADNRTSDGEKQTAISALMPCLAGWPSPVAALYRDDTRFFRTHEIRREPFPVAIAVWKDGTVVRSINPDGFRSPYSIGSIPETSVTVFLQAAEDMGLFASDLDTTYPEPITLPSVISLVTDGHALTLKRASRNGRSLSATEQAEWDLLKGALTELADVATKGTTHTLVFDQRCVSAAQPVLADQKLEGLPGEVRAAWAAAPFIALSPEIQDREIEALRVAGFNTLCINTQSRQWVQYPGSRYLYQAPPSGSRNLKVMDTLVGATHRRGMRAEAWAEYGFYASYSKETTMTFALLIRHPHLAAIDKEGRDYFQSPLGFFKSLCPANPESHKLLIGLYSEMLQKFPFDGINLDRIRFPNPEFCYCDYCRTHFAEDTGIKLEVFAEGSAEWKTWMRWRQEQVTVFMRSFSKEIRAKFPGRTITVCAVHPDEREAKGQDWTAWLKEDLVDAVVPLLYGGPDVATGMAAIQKLVPDQSRVIYGFLPWNEVGDDICKMREAGGRGYSVWHMGTLTPAARDAFDAANTPFGPGPSMLK